MGMPKMFLVVQSIMAINPTTFFFFFLSLPKKTLGIAQKIQLPTWVIEKIQPIVND